VDQGWISPDGEETSFSEAILVEFDPQVISLQVLTEIHLLSHSSHSDHKMRTKYRSAIYVHDQQQKDEVSEIVRILQMQSTKKYITQVLPMGAFKRNKSSLLNYYQTRPNAPFCTTYIEPKIKALIKTHQQYLNH